MSYDKGYEDGLADGQHKALNEIVSWLFQIEAVRDSMLGPEWLVIYTINGALDIRKSDIYKALERKKIEQA